MNADLVQSLYIDARLKLLQAMKEMKYSFDIDTLCNMRRKCFSGYMDEQHRSRQQQTQLLAPQALQTVPPTTTVQLLSIDENQTVTEVTTYETITQFQPQQIISDAPIQATLQFNNTDMFETMSQDSDEGHLTIALPDETPNSTENQEVQYRLVPTTTISSNENETLLSVITNDYENTMPTTYFLTSSEPVTIQFDSPNLNSAAMDADADQVSVYHLVFPS